MMESEIDLIDRFIRDLSYEPIAGPGQHALDRWYRAIISSTVSAYLFLDYKPKAKVFGVTAYVNVNDALDLAKGRLQRTMALASAGRYLDPLKNAPAWTGFLPARLFGWSYMAITGQASRTNLESRLIELRDEFLWPTVLSARSVRDVLTLYLRTDVPFDWLASNAVVRAAEVSALGAVACLTRTELMSLLIPQEKAILRDCAAGVSISDIVDLYS